MKTRYPLLLKMQLYNFFGINRALHSHSKREKQHRVAFGVLATLAAGLMIAYSATISIGLASMGATNILPTLSTLVCSLIILILTFLKSSGVLVGLRDYDMVMSLPVTSIEIVLSRLTMLYLTNLFISMVVALPSVIIYWQNAEAGTLGSVFFLVSLLFIPVIPMIVSLGLGVLITVISSRSKHKNIFSLVLSTLVVLLIVAASTQAQRMNPDELLDIGRTLSNAATRIYPPAAFVSMAVENQNIPAFFIFIATTVLIAGCFVGIVSNLYQKMNTAISSHSAVKYEGKGLKVSSPFKAMYKREFARYFSCTIYALNSTIGMVLLLVVALLLMFISPETLEKRGPGRGS